MVEKSYTPAELADADRLTKAIASVPEEKRPAFIRLIEAMVMGASLADRLSNQRNVS